MRRISLRDRGRYLFDTVIARGTWVMLAGLGAATTVIVVLAAMLVVLAGAAPDGEDFPTLVWMAFMRTLDAGTMGGDQGSPLFVGMMFVVTIGGVFVLGTLIGILNTGLEERLSLLRRGRSLVLEEDHTVILGWGPEVFTIVRELIVANESRRRGAAVVILAPRDKVEMETDVRERVGALRNTRVICRSGNPVDPGDLTLANLHGSRSIIVLPQGDDPDIQAVKTLVALTNAPDRRSEPYVVVVPIRQAATLDVVRLLSKRDRILPVLAADVIARLAAQASRQVGLSAVYTELLDFSGDEFYVHQDRALLGATFASLQTAFDDCTVVGLHGPQGVALNPDPGTTVGPDDRLVLIAADDDRIRLASGWSSANPDAPATAKRSPSAPDLRPAVPESLLVLGWNAEGPTILQELDQYVPAGSRVHVVAHLGIDLDAVHSASAGLQNQTVTVTQGDISDRELLEGLRAAAYDHVIVLANTHLGAEKADAVTLVTLLQLRDIAERDDTPFSIVSEMLDVRNRELAEVTRADDFIVSEHLISLLMAQLSENPALADVFTDLFDADGSEIYMKPVAAYVAPGEEIAIRELTRLVSARGEVLLGFRLDGESHDRGNGYGVHLNPPKSLSRSFTERDRLVVLAES